MTLISAPDLRRAVWNNLPREKLSHTGLQRIISFYARVVSTICSLCSPSVPAPLSLWHDPPASTMATGSARASAVVELDTDSDISDVQESAEQPNSAVNVTSHCDRRTYPQIYDETPVSLFSAHGHLTVDDGSDDGKKPSRNIVASHNELYNRSLPAAQLRTSRQPTSDKRRRHTLEASEWHAAESGSLNPRCHTSCAASTDNMAGSMPPQGASEVLQDGRNPVAAPETTPPSPRTAKAEVAVHSFGYARADDETSFWGSVAAMKGGGNSNNDNVYNVQDFIPGKWPITQMRHKSWTVRRSLRFRHEPQARHQCRQ